MNKRFLGHLLWFIWGAVTALNGWFSIHYASSLGIFSPIGDEIFGSIGLVFGGVLVGVGIASYFGTGITKK